MYENENLIKDPIHGYIPVCAKRANENAAERDLIDSPWVQRLRQIRQLQTAWLVFPSAEHSRFQHSLGAMFLASRVFSQFWDSFPYKDSAPSKAYLESLVRIAALLHDVGHGPFGHFFDEHFLADYGLTHETLGAEIIRRELAPLIREIRRNPNGCLLPDETLDPEQIAFLIVRPNKKTDTSAPIWLQLLRSLFCGIYTVDNMDFVLRDAYMTGFSTKSFDIDRLLHYSFWTEKGVAIHDKGLSVLTRFIATRAEMFRAIYYHRTVKAIDLGLAHLFKETKDLLFQGDPLERLDNYLRFTDWTLFADVANWRLSKHPKKQLFAADWEAFMQRQYRWILAAEKTIAFSVGDNESTSIFANRGFAETAIRHLLPKEKVNIPFEVDIAKHSYRPDEYQASSGNNWLYDSAQDKIRPLKDSELFRDIPQSYRIFRVYTQNTEDRAILINAVEKLLNSGGGDDLTNM